MPANSAQAHFRSIAPHYMRLFMQDFGASELDAAAVFGNAGHESAGFTKLQEMRPTVKGSRGGWGWFQWTGPRRVAFEAYCKRHGFDPASDEANYKWLFIELTTTEKDAIAKLKAAGTLEAKVKAFELAYERAGVKHYPSRNQWAQIALDALGATTPVEADLPSEPVEIPTYQLPPATGGAQPNFWPILIVSILAALVGAATWLLGGTPEPAAPPQSLLGGAPVPLDRPMSLFGGPGVGTSIGGAIALEIAKAFILPLVSAGVTAAVGWVVYWWQRLLKSRFDQASAEQLHAALERGILAAIDALGSRASKSSLISHAADYAASNNPGAVRHFKLGFSDLERLATPHLVKAKGRG